MRIAVDAMGGDHAPLVNVEGAFLALAEDPAVEVVLVGDQTVLEPLVKQRGGTSNPRLTIHHTAESIAMGESPAQALRKKKGASLNVIYHLQKKGEAAASISAGSTGGMMAAGLLNLGRLKGVQRPAIATFMPTATGTCILLDVGANVDSKPEHLVQFAAMGSLYYQYLFNVARPRVALLNMGEEETKGNAAAREAHQLLTAQKVVHFIGNVEGRDIFRGAADVIVCDGFVGNIVLKFAESIKFFGKSLVGSIFAPPLSKIGAAMMVPGLIAMLPGLAFLIPGFKRVMKLIDYRAYGGAPLLGIDGVGIVAHGSSDAQAIKNGILAAKRVAEKNVNQHIQTQLVELGLASTHDSASA